MIDVISEGMKGNVVALSGHQTVTREDYETVIIPVIEQRLRAYPKIRLLYFLGADFRNFSAAALWDDFKIGLQHLTSFEKIAMVTDVGLVRDTVRLFSFLVPCPVKIFGNSAFSEAAGWVNQ